MGYSNNQSTKEVSIKTTFVVKTTGYSESFISLNSAIAAYESLKKKLARRGEDYTVTLEQKTGLNKEVLQRCKVSQDMIEEN